MTFPDQAEKTRKTVSHCDPKICGVVYTKPKAKWRWTANVCKDVFPMKGLYQTE